MAALQAPPDARVTLFTAVEAISASLPALLPANTRATIASEVSRANRERVAAAREGLARAADTLTTAGWKVSLVVTTGAPLQGLLATVDRTKPDLLVVGVRGVTGLRQLLLASVAEGALSRSPVPVLLAR